MHPFIPHTSFLFLPPFFLFNESDELFMLPERLPPDLQHGIKLLFLQRTECVFVCVCVCELSHMIHVKFAGRLLV